MPQIRGVEPTEELKEHEPSQSNESGTNKNDRTYGNNSSLVHEALLALDVHCRRIRTRKSVGTVFSVNGGKTPVNVAYSSELIRDNPRKSASVFLCFDDTNGFISMRTFNCIENRAKPLECGTSAPP